MRQLIVALLVIFGLLIAIKMCAQTAGAAETTPLDDAVERKSKVKVETFVDEENGVVCYYIAGSFGHFPRDLECVKVKQ
jgi:hypothetical protein